MNYIRNRCFLLLIIMVILVFFTNEVLHPVYASNGKSHSSIAGIEIDANDKKEIEQKLLQEILMWKETPLIIKIETGEIEIDTSLIKFNTNATIKDYQALTKKPWYQFWVKNVVDVPIHFIIDDEIVAILKTSPSINIDETIEKMNDQIGYFLANSIQAVEEDSITVQEHRIALVLEDITVNRTSLSLLIDKLNGKNINVKEKFSYLESLGNLPEAVDQQTIDYLASVLYSLVLQTNYEIIERHPSVTIMKPFTPGQEAIVNNLLKKDLIFKNNNIVSGTLKISLKDNMLTAEIFSIPLDETVDVFESEKQEIQPRVIYRYSDKLPFNEEEIVEVGEVGLKVSVYRKVSEKYGSFETDTLMSRDFYPPIHKVIIRSSLQPEVVSPVPPSTDSGTLTNEGNTTNPDTNQNAGTSPNNTSNSEGSNTSGKPGESAPSNDSNDDNNTNNSNNNIEYDKGGNIIESSGK